MSLYHSCSAISSSQLSLLTGRGSPCSILSTSYTIHTSGATISYTQSQKLTTGDQSLLKHLTFNICVKPSIISRPELSTPTQNRTLLSINSPCMPHMRIPHHSKHFNLPQSVRILYGLIPPYPIVNQCS